MSNNKNIYEPEVDPLDDTNPSMWLRPAALERRVGQPISGWRRALGLISLLAAAGFTLATVWLLLTPQEESAAIPPTQIVSQAATATIAPVVDVPTTIPATSAPGVTVDGQQIAQLPTIDPAQAAALLATPIGAQTIANSMRIENSVANPFTTIPDRPRNEIIQYQVQRGDTINKIAELFGLKPETIAWSNERRIIQVLREGDLVNIPPVDGVLITAIGTQNTIASLAAQYAITDPMIVIESEFNNLKGLSPESVPPSGIQIFFPGGVAEQISWNPEVVREEGGGGAGGSSGGFISFAPGEAGSCGRVANPGGGGSWVRPVDAYTVTRGFSGFHTGIDLSAPEGTPVKAANGGRVIFAGWNSYGYGYTVVLAHGPFTTLYGHLSQIYVGCGADVAPGQTIAGVGNTGNSSGAHLHFEIRYNDAASDPSATIPF